MSGSPPPRHERAGAPTLRRTVSALVALLSLGLPASPVRAQQIPTFSSNVKVVNVPATVRTKKGEIVRDLTKDDFTVSEDGRPQTIKYFAKESDLPLSIGLLVDTSLSQRRLIDQERSASFSFLRQMLREDKDRAFVIHFEGEVELLQDLTSSRQKLESALNALETPQQVRRGGGGGWPGSGRRGAAHGTGGTALYDAVFLASDEVIRKQEGRKALIILSDGVDNASRVSLERAIESAQRADTMVYSILFADEEGYGGGWGRIGGGMGRRGGGYPRYPQPQSSTADGKKVLERISRETGAHLFEVSKKLPINEIYARIQEELRNQYSLGYTPDRIEGGYHKIHLATKQKDLIVQARDGYYAQP
ncbi:MAG: VWA domain-containing protein [Acidobacteriia bacterium]|nr:VWA domain-containing protein [Terriglobia bacterium]